MLRPLVRVKASQRQFKSGSAILGQLQMRSLHQRPFVLSPDLVNRKVSLNL
jgi:hypothetical protein